ncbi:MAG: Na+/H+ antiporter NhaA, partial [Mitsuokella jalaludinii]|nr:Na+/H+ antiporter NhaA [Mitsuokella jalaludinii]
FFFVIGLEIKREFLYGELRTYSAMLLPVGAALGGMLVPAALYAAINAGLPTFGGWGIPMATDIAFALGIMTIAARQAPLGLVVFLTALAIVDDLGAIVVIALFYNTDLTVSALLLGLVAVAAAFLLGRFRVRFLPAYMALGFVAWLAFLKAGIHPTIAGVLLGLSIPAAAAPEASLLHKLEHALEPWSAYAIMPIFALANAGVAISLATFDVASPIFLGILAGLCLGKPLGIFGAVFVLCKVFGLQLPGNATKSQLAATGMLGGIGFTMSIFIASLAFTDSAMLDLAKISILSASILSGILGTAFFKLQSLFGGGETAQQ